jgi:hypothetical protein
MIDEMSKLYGIYNPKTVEQTMAKAADALADAEDDLKKCAATIAAKRAVITAGEQRLAHLRNTRFKTYYILHKHTFKRSPKTIEYSFEAYTVQIPENMKFDPVLSDLRQTYGDRNEKFSKYIIEKLNARTPEYIRSEKYEFRIQQARAACVNVLRMAGCPVDGEIVIETEG